MPFGLTPRLLLRPIRDVVAEPEVIAERISVRDNSGGPLSSALPLSALFAIDADLSASVVLLGLNRDSAEFDGLLRLSFSVADILVLGLPLHAFCNRRALKSSRDVAPVLLRLIALRCPLLDNLPFLFLSIVEAGLPFPLVRKVNTSPLTVGDVGGDAVDLPPNDSLFDL